MKQSLPSQVSQRRNYGASSLKGVISATTVRQLGAQCCNKQAVDRRKRVCQLSGTIAATVFSVGLFATGVAQAKRSLLDVPVCRNYKETSNNVKWCDVTVGKGESPLYGDLVIIDFTARASEKQFDSGSNYAFAAGTDAPLFTSPGLDMAVLGSDEIPPMKPGGIRTVIVPPELGYGKKGLGCQTGACRVKPNTEIEVAIKYYGLGFK